MLFFICAKENVFFLKKSCKCLPVTAKRSNFASRLLSTHTMGERCFRSLSCLKDTIQPIGRGWREEGICLISNSVRGLAEKCRNDGIY